MAAALFGVPWVAWGGLCLLVATVYTAIWPRPATAGAGRVDPPRRRRALRWRRRVLRWGHALVWLLLALSCFLRAAPRAGGAGAANLLAGLALAGYAVFLGTLLIDRAGRR
jgi:hypothetical protein